VAVGWYIPARIPIPKKAMKSWEIFWVSPTRNIEVATPPKPTVTITLRFTLSASHPMSNWEKPEVME
jgi:hypothetical protein